MRAEGILNKVRMEGRVCLTEIESKALLESYGIPVVESRLAVSQQDAVSYSKELGFPVVMKIISPDISHKSEAGGVKLNLQNITQVKTAYREIMASARKYNPDACIHGMAIETVARPGIELIIGMSKDVQFGPMIMFGLGGIMVEIIQDVSFRFLPISRQDADEMLREIKGYPLLTGFRGSEAIDLYNIETLLVKLSDLVLQHPEIKELDINPLFAYKNAAAVVDARIILEPQG